MFHFAYSDIERPHQVKWSPDYTCNCKLMVTQQITCHVMVRHLVKQTREPVYAQSKFSQNDDRIFSHVWYIIKNVVHLIHPHFFNYFPNTVSIMCVLLKVMGLTPNERTTAACLDQGKWNIQCEAVVSVSERLLCSTLKQLLLINKVVGRKTRIFQVVTLTDTFPLCASGVTSFLLSICPILMNVMSRDELIRMWWRKLKG